MELIALRFDTVQAYNEALDRVFARRAILEQLVIVVGSPMPSRYSPGESEAISFRVENQQELERLSGSANVWQALCQQAGGKR